MALPEELDLQGSSLGRKTNDLHPFPTKVMSFQRKFSGTKEKRFPLISQKVTEGIT